ncbi:hypothetical protein AX774_g4194 [Zancudomyces culisetae]|uniref:Uncharacterized protein n=1 Tax=Zancudomyces culisetae TaxID=1213189 RepID=A0A1R1PFT3_ZANCU|nr:hypothetical protein AX774_g6703 [Zancudomyces culisetae]OMH82330.1 hypothetical protein AX774_g4194 [Zancudomyces culisetae]|eukprot:OMH79875.1 hypothetical protein AX774_g6703 [Zancudomyces culisetae]
MLLISKDEFYNVITFCEKHQTNFTCFGYPGRCVDGNRIEKVTGGKEGRTFSTRLRKAEPPRDYKKKLQSFFSLIFSNPTRDGNKMLVTVIFDREKLLKEKQDLEEEFLTLIKKKEKADFLYNSEKEARSRKP